MKDEKRKQQLQDRQDYRTSLINKRDEIDRKIAHYLELKILVGDQQAQHGIASLIEELRGAKATIRCDLPEQE